MQEKYLWLFFKAKVQSISYICMSSSHTLNYLNGNFCLYIKLLQSFEIFAVGVWFDFEKKAARLYYIAWVLQSTYNIFEMWSIKSVVYLH